jgi:hypothetical protein
VCALKKTSRTAYLAQLATHHAKQELLRYAAKAYLDGHVSLSALATETGLDVPTIMDEVSRLSGEDSHTRDDFLAAVKTLSHVNHDPDFYRLAVKALTDSSESKV